MPEPNSTRVDRATRVIAAEVDDVYQAFVDPEAVVKWLPPKGARATLEAFEPREGGAFCMTLVFEGPHARGKTQEDTDVVRGTFDRLVPGQSITQRFDFVSDDPDFAGTMTMRWTLRREDACIRRRGERSTRNFTGGSPERHGVFAGEPCCLPGTSCALVQFDDFDAPVLRPPFLGVVGSGGRQHADTGATQALGVDAMVGCQCFDH
jgi:uncharacterized protein YndB with AHSA1/START domain